VQQQTDNPSTLASITKAEAANMLMLCAEIDYTPTTHQEKAYLLAMLEWVLDDRDYLSFIEYLDMEYLHCCLACKSIIKNGKECFCSINYKKT